MLPQDLLQPLRNMSPWGTTQLRPHRGLSPLMPEEEEVSIGERVGRQMFETKKSEDPAEDEHR